MCGTLNLNEIMIKYNLKRFIKFENIKGKDEEKYGIIYDPMVKCKTIVNKGKGIVPIRDNHFIGVTDQDNFILFELGGLNFNEFRRV